MKFICLLLLLFIPQLYAQNNDIPENPVLVSTKLWQNGEDQYLVLSFKNHDGWHTYWKNPGDAGLPIKTVFKHNEETLDIQELEWPIPRKYIEPGDILAYGYSGTYSFFYPYKDILKSLNGSSVQINSKWLVCKHVCIPGQVSINAQLTPDQIDLEKKNPFTITNKMLENQFKNLPASLSWPNGLDILLFKSNEKENLLAFQYSYYSSEKKTYFKSEQNLIIPFPQAPFNFKREQLYKDKKKNFYGNILIEWDGEYQEPEIPLPSDGVFAAPYSLKFLFQNPKDGKTYVIQKEFSEFNINGFKASQEFLSLVEPIKNLPEADQAKDDSTQDSIWYFIFMAFIGGLILNVMPCVLPVISLKLFGLLAHGHDSKKDIFLHNLFYSLGIILSFMVLAGVILIIKSAGDYVGWGFQLQSPSFVAVMIFIIFIFSLNLFGLFEFSTPGGKVLGDVELKKGFGGDFLSGVLATILSTPCSAPFLGTALTFAFTSSWQTILIVFFFIGIGLSFPFILTAFFPAIISFLPKPGLWMETVKKFLGLTLLLTIIWLMDVFVSQVSGTLPLLKLNTALVLIFFTFYIRKSFSKKSIITFVLFFLSLFFLVNIVLTSDTGSDSTHLLEDKKATGLEWEKWSPQLFDELKESKTPTFVDFTAKWCFTCKVNEKLVLETSEFKDFIKASGVRLLLADWTKRDEIIGNWLENRGKVGIPAYFVINDQGKVFDLGETITVDEIKKAFK
ncbi:MAG: thioredoxin family protein [Bacteriovoracaceae bacterium]